MPSPSSIRIDVSSQTLTFTDRQGIERTYPVSTAANGTGSREGSYKTPLGQFRIADKIGTGLPAGTVFRSRIPIGIWPGDLPEDCPPDSDLILTRILWLDGLEEENANTYDRYIYIHGTNWEDRLGTPASCGCIRMASLDIIALYDLVDDDTLVTING